MRIFSSPAIPIFQYFHALQKLLIPIYTDLHLFSKEGFVLLPKGCYRENARKLSAVQVSALSQSDFATMQREKLRRIRFLGHHCIQSQSTPQ